MPFLDLWTCYEFCKQLEEGEKFLHMYPVSTLHHSLLQMFGGSKEPLKTFLVAQGVISEEKEAEITKGERNDVRKRNEERRLRLSKKARLKKENGQSES